MVELVGVEDALLWNPSNCDVTKCGWSIAHASLWLHYRGSKSEDKTKNGEDKEESI